MYKNELKDVPQEIIDKMLERQVEQGNPKDANVFDDCLSTGKCAKGFEWIDSKEGVQFWRDVLLSKNYNLFFERYPKPQYPKVMKVWGHSEDDAVNRVVFMEKCGIYLAWASAETLKEAERISGVTDWPHAKDIEPIPQPKEMTVEQISKELGYEIKIVK